MVEDTGAPVQYSIFIAMTLLAPDDFLDLPETKHLGMRYCLRELIQAANLALEAIQASHRLASDDIFESVGTLIYRSIRHREFQNFFHLRAILTGWQQRRAVSTNIGRQKVLPPVRIERTTSGLL